MVGGTYAGTSLTKRGVILADNATCISLLWRDVSGARSPGRGGADLLMMPTMYGGLLTGVLALIALVSLRLKWKDAVVAVLIFNIVGTVDLLNIMRHAEANFGAAWYIPILLVPLLLVTHVMIFDRMPKRMTIAQNSTLK
jgi:hypothetical protein